MRVPQVLRSAVIALTASGIGLLGISASGPVPAASGPATAQVATPQLALAAATRPRFVRETVRYGARDASPYAISHVYEVQIRLRWAGIYRGPFTGYFGAQTLAAVKAFQKSQHLPQTGIVETRTWARLIPVSTMRHGGWSTLPAVCRRSGWHTCYSRSTHELITLYNNTLWNAWLVRGGAANLPTVRGTFRVYWQHRDHRSSLFNNAPMPYSQFFYRDEAIHGSATMVNPGSGHSHGCINMYIEDAAELWRLTYRHSHTVTVYGPWA